MASCRWIIIEHNFLKTLQIIAKIYIWPLYNIPWQTCEQEPPVIPLEWQQSAGRTHCCSLSGWVLFGKPAVTVVLLWPWLCCDHGFAVTVALLCVLQAAALQLPALWLPPGLAVGLAAPAPYHRPVHLLPGARRPARLPRGWGAEEGLCLLW